MKFLLFSLFAGRPPGHSRRRTSAVTTGATWVAVGCALQLGAATAQAQEQRTAADPARGANAAAPLPSDAALTVYGRLNVAAESVSGGGHSRESRLSNYRSVLGFKGQESLGDDLRAVWQIEGSVLVDSGGGTSFANRDTRLGLTGSWGTAFAGVWTLPYNAATAGFDPFYPTTAGYMALISNGSASIASNVSDTPSFDRRQQNVMQYWTPTWDGWSGKLAYSPGKIARPSRAPVLRSGPARPRM